MQVITASDVKNRLGDLFDAVELDQSATVMIERNHRPVAMLLNAQIAEKVILGAYAQGVVSRSVAMQQLGLDWYGDLVIRMNALGIPRPAAPAEDVAQMRAAADHAFSETAPSTRARGRSARSR